MIQHIIYEGREPNNSSTKSTNTNIVHEEQSVKSKVKDVRMIDRNGKIVNRPLHRKEFKRSTVRKKSVNSQSHRYYFQDEKMFDRLLEKYNTSQKQTIAVHAQSKDDESVSRHHFLSSGLVNVNLKLCSRCGDIDKTHKLETYFIDQNQKAKARTIFCYGCIGLLLNKFQEGCEVFE